MRYRLADEMAKPNRDKKARTRAFRRQYLENWKFLVKYTSMKYETSSWLNLKRSKAYAKRYNMGNDCWVQYGVTIVREHFSDAAIKMGDHVKLMRGCDIDYTGDLEIGNHVSILEGVKILTHMHDTMDAIDPSLYIPFSNRAVKTPLKIGDSATICAHAIILPGVKEIGENSQIQAGAIVSRRVPSNTIVRADGKRITIPSWAVVPKE